MEENVDQNETGRKTLQLMEELQQTKNALTTLATEHNKLTTDYEALKRRYDNERMSAMDARAKVGAYEDVLDNLHSKLVDRIGS